MSKITRGPRGAVTDPEITGNLISGSAVVYVQIAPHQQGESPAVWVYLCQDRKDGSREALQRVGTVMLNELHRHLSKACRKEFTIQRLLAESALQQVVAERLLPDFFSKNADDSSSPESRIISGYDALLNLPEAREESMTIFSATSPDEMEAQLDELREQVQAFKESQGALAAQTVKLMSERAALRDELEAVVTRAKQSNEQAVSDDQVAQLSEQLREARKARLAAESSVSDLDSRLAQTQQELERLKKASLHSGASKEEALKKAQEALFESQSAFERLSSDSKEKNQLLENLSSTVQALVSTTERLQAEISEVTKRAKDDRSSARSELKIVRETAERDLRKLEEQLAAERAQAQSGTEELARLRVTLSTLERDLEAVRKNEHGLKQEKERLEQELEGQRLALDETRRSASEATRVAEAETTRTVEALKEQLAHAQSEITTLRERAAESEKRKSEILQLRGQRDELEEAQKSFAARLGKEQVEHQRTLERARKADETIETHLRSIAELTTQVEEIVAGRNEIKRESEDREKEVKRLHEELAQSTSQVEGLRVQLEERERECLELALKIRDAESIDTGKSNEIGALKTELAQRAKEIEQLKVDNQVLRDTLEEARSAKERVDQEGRERENSLQTEIEQISRRSEAERKQLQTALTEAGSRLTTKESELSEALEAHARLAQQLQTLTTDLGGLKSSAEQTERSLGKQKEEADFILNSVKRSFDAEMNKAQAHHKRLQEALMASESRAEGMAHELERERARSAKSTTCLEELKAQQTQLMEALEQSREKVQTLEHGHGLEKRNTSEIIASLREELSGAISRRGELESDLENAQAQIVRLTETINKSEESLVKENAILAQQVESLKERLKGLSDVWVEKAKLAAKLAKLTAQYSQATKPESVANDDQESQGDSKGTIELDTPVEQLHPEGEAVSKDESRTQQAFVQHDDRRLSIQYAETDPRNVVVVFESSEGEDGKGIAFVIVADEHARELPASVKKRYKDKPHYFLQRYFSGILDKPERLAEIDDVLERTLVRLLNQDNVTILGLSNMSFAEPFGSVPLAVRHYEERVVQEAKQAASRVAEVLAANAGAGARASNEEAPAAAAGTESTSADAWKERESPLWVGEDTKSHLSGRLKRGVWKFLKNTRLH